MFHILPPLHHTPYSTRMGKKLQPERETNVLTAFKMNKIATLVGETKANSSNICTLYFDSTLKLKQNKQTEK